MTALKSTGQGAPCCESMKKIPSPCVCLPDLILTSSPMSNQVPFVSTVRAALQVANAAVASQSFL
ncbi:hypothetical protein [Methylicorpusculum sp.]|uniref:hypothetical protein n=1 Tax=Methylicorpusculum sp. TaxID=2713644 RepID=UPI00272D8FBD|nr:hypothetical protein [Methylicorpusculum sp.]MDP3527865.1 hypothetical protein [Methylicorpusculum sp.]